MSSCLDCYVKASSFKRTWKYVAPFAPHVGIGTSVSCFSNCESWTLCCLLRSKRILPRSADKFWLLLSRTGKVHPWFLGCLHDERTQIAWHWCGTPSDVPVCRETRWFLQWKSACQLWARHLFLAEIVVVYGKFAGWQSRGCSGKPPILFWWSTEDVWLVPYWSRRVSPRSTWLCSAHCVQTLLHGRVCYCHESSIHSSAEGDAIEHHRATSMSFAKLESDGTWSYCGGHFFSLVAGILAPCHQKWDGVEPSCSSRSHSWSGNYAPRCGFWICAEVRASIENMQGC